MASREKSNSVVFLLWPCGPNHNRLDWLGPLQCRFKLTPQRVPHRCRGFPHRNHDNPMKIAEVVRKLSNVERFALITDASPHYLFNPQMMKSVEKNAFGLFE